MKYNEELKIGYSENNEWFTMAYFLDTFLIEQNNEILDDIPLKVIRENGWNSVKVIQKDIKYVPSDVIYRVGYYQSEVIYEDNEEVVVCSTRH